MRTALALVFSVGLWATGVGAGYLLATSPSPDPTPPGPSPGPSPIKVDDLVVLLVEETNERNQLTVDQLAVLTGNELRDWLDANKAQYRIWDKDIDATREKEFWRQMLALPRDSTPWIYVSNGKTAASQPVKDVADTIALLEKFRAN